MKRYISFFLILILMILAGCTADPEPTTQTVELPEISTKPLDLPETTQPVTTQPVTTPPETTAPPPETTTSAPVYYPNDITHGFVYENVYICGFLGLNYFLPEGQTFYTDAQLAESQGFTAETITDEDVQRVFEQTGYFLDMQTYGDEGDPFVNLSYQDLNTFGPVSDAADYFEKSKAPTIRTLEALGFTDVSFEVEDYELGGVKCASAVIRAKSGETPIYERMVGVIMDHYVAMLTASGPDESADALLQGFFWMQS